MPEVKLSEIARELIPVESIDLLTKVQLTCDSIVSVEIQNPGQYEQACGTTKELQDLGNKLELERKALKKPFDDKGKVIQEAFVPFLNSLESAKKKIKQAVWAYQEAMERKRREEQEKLNREAEEKRRVAEEAARKEREKAEALRAHGREDLAERADIRADAKENKAAEILAPVAVAPIPATLPRGVAGRVLFRGVIECPEVFVKFCIAENKHEWIMPNEKKFSDYAKYEKKVMEFPGARIVKEMV